MPADLAPSAGAEGWFDWGEFGRYAVRVEAAEAAEAVGLALGARGGDTGCGRGTVDRRRVDADPGPSGSDPARTP